MAHPRFILPAQTYLVTRRCAQRAFRLRPTTETNDIFRYCLAFALQKTGVRLHAVCVMSNHHHMVVTDPDGVLPDFLRELHRLTAKALNASQGQNENLWSTEKCNVVRLVTEDDVDAKIAYVVINPVTDGLVRNPGDWPGVLEWGARSRRVARPRRYFADEGACPPELDLRIEAPPAMERSEEEPPDTRLARVRRLIESERRRAQQAIETAGRTFLGAALVRSASFERRSQSAEMKRDVIPTFAAMRASVREGLRRAQRAFRAAYRIALGDWRKGDREVVFPFGTWAMRVFHAAQVGPPLIG